MTVTIGDLIAGVMQGRATALSTEDPLKRQELALNVLQDAMFMAHKLLGEDLLRAAIGTVDPNDKVAVLVAVARRIHALSAVFGTMVEDVAAPFKVVEEAVAVAHGDAPLMFARVDGHKINDRINRAKSEALLWDAYLKGRGIGTSERRSKISAAFGHGWETIRRGWKRDVANTFDNSTFSYLLKQAEGEGRRLLPRWKMLGSVDWEAALNADGQRFLQVQRENNGNR